MEDALISLPMREEMLLRKIEAQLRQRAEIERPLKAADIMTTVSTDELAEIMSWAQISLRDYV